MRKYIFAFLFLSFALLCKEGGAQAQLNIPVSVEAMGTKTVTTPSHFEEGDGVGVYHPFIVTVFN